MPVLAKNTKELNPESLIADLGAQQAEKRDLAESQLRQMGKEALPFLEEACLSEDPEISLRAERLLLQIKTGFTDNSSSSPLSVFHATYLKTEDDEERERLMQQLFENKKSTAKELIAAAKIRQNLTPKDELESSSPLNALSYLSQHEEAILLQKLSEESRPLLEKEDKKALLELWQDIEISPQIRLQFLHWAFLFSEDISALLSSKPQEIQTLAKAQLALLERNAEAFSALIPELKALPLEFSAPLLSSFYASQKDTASFYGLKLEELWEGSPSPLKLTAKEALQQLKEADTLLPEENVLRHLYLTKALEKKATKEEQKLLQDALFSAVAQLNCPQENPFAYSQPTKTEESTLNLNWFRYTTSLSNFLQRADMKENLFKENYPKICEQRDFTYFLSVAALGDSASDLQFLGISEPTPENIKAYLEGFVPVFDEKKGFAQKIDFNKTPIGTSLKFSHKDKKILAAFSLIAPYLAKRGAAGLLLPYMLGHLQSENENASKSVSFTAFYLFFTLQQLSQHPHSRALTEPLFSTILPQTTNLPRELEKLISQTVLNPPLRQNPFLGLESQKPHALKTFFEKKYPQLSTIECLLFLYHMSSGRFISENEFNQNWQAVFAELENPALSEKQKTLLAQEAASLLCFHAPLSHPKTQELLLSLWEKCPEPLLSNNDFLSQLKLAKVLLDKGSPELKKQILASLEENKQKLNPPLLNTLLFAFYEDLGEKEKAQHARQKATLWIGDAVKFRVIEDCFTSKKSSQKEQFAAFLPLFAEPYLPKNLRQIYDIAPPTPLTELSAKSLQEYALEEDALYLKPEKVQEHLFLKDTLFTSFFNNPPLYFPHINIHNLSSQLACESAFYQLVAKNLPHPSPELLEDWRALKKNPLIQRDYSYAFFCTFPHLAPALLEDMKKEIKEEEKALKIWPKDENLKLALALKLYLTGEDKERAKELVKKILQNNPLHLKATEALKLFEENR